VSHSAPSFRLITIASDEPLFEVVARGMRDAATALGVTAELVGTPGFEVREIVDLVRRAIADGVDGIGLNIFHPTALAQVIAEAARAGVPVVAFNIDAAHTANGNLSFVMQDFVRAGETLGRRARAKIARNTRIVVSTHDADIDALEQRAAGLLTGIGRDSKDVIRVVTGRDPLAAAELLAGTVDGVGRVALLATGQPDTEAAGLVASRRPATYAAGFDLSPGIVDLIAAGHLDCTIDQQPYVQGFYPIVQLTLLLRYGLRPSSFDAGQSIVDRSNVEAVRNLSRQFIR
jgi:simple sugar transport system substrate-binding protein